MGDICRDNRFEIIDKAKEDILKRTNISSSENEMKVLDSFLFRCWQMGWLDRYDEKKKQRMNVIQRLLEKMCCKHEWHFVCDAKHVDEFGGRYTRRTLVCINCGKIKQIVL